MRKTQSLQEVLKSWMKKSGKEDLFFELKIKDCWRELLGEKINSKTKSMHWVYQDQILLIKIGDPLLRNELSYAKESIREKLNGAIPEIDILKIVIM